MDGAEALLEALKREGVDVLFGISGGAILPIYDALGQAAGHLEHPDAPRTGRRAHGRRLRARHRPRRMLHRHIGAGRDQPRHGHHRCVYGFDADCVFIRSGRHAQHRQRCLSGMRHFRHHHADCQAFVSGQESATTFRASSKKRFTSRAPDAPARF